MEKSLRTCISCGQQKPLTAFLQLSGPEGSTYGNVCSSCRKTAMEKEKAPKDKEESTTGTTGFKINSKSKVEEDTVKHQFRKQVEELYHEERDKDELLQLAQEQKVQGISKEEKKHRSSKSLFNWSPNDKPNPNDPDQQVFSGEQQTAKEKRIDLRAPVIDTQFAGKQKYGTVFRQFVTRTLGEDSQAARTFLSATQKDKSLPKVTKESLKETLTETAEKLWRPKK